MKRFVATFVVVVVVLFAAAVVLPMALSGRVDRAVRSHAAERLDVRLDVSSISVNFLRHFPRPSIQLHDLHLVGNADFATDTLLSADRVSVVIDLLPLLSGQIDVSKTTIVRPVVHARKLTDGAENWHILKDSIDSVASRDVQPLRFVLRDVRIRGGQMFYQNDSTRVRFTASPVKVRLFGDLASSKSNMNLRVNADQICLSSGGAVLVSKANAEFDAKVNVDVVNRRCVFLENSLQLNAMHLSLNGWFDLSKPGVATMDIQADCSKVQFKELLSMVPAFYSRDFNSLAASADMTLSAWVKGRAYDSHLPAFELKLGVKGGRLQYSSLPKAVTDIQIAARVASRGGTFDSAVLELSEFAATVAGNPIKVALSLSTPLSNLSVDGSVSGVLDFSELSKVYPLDINNAPTGRISADLHIAGRLSDIDSQRYEAVHASGSFVVERMKLVLQGMPEMMVRRASASISPNAVTLGEFGVTVGSSELIANGQLTGYIGYLLDGRSLAGRLYVRSQLIDLNEFMAITPSGADSAARTALVVPRDLSLLLFADVAKIRFGKMSCSDFVGEVHTQNGTAVLNRASMRAFGGTILASGSYSTAFDAQRPALSMALDIVHASFQHTYEEFELVQRVAPIFSKTEGSYSMTLDISTLLDGSMTSDLATLDARGEIRSADLKIRNVATFAQLAQVLHTEQLRTVEARDVAVRFDVQQGRITTQSFDLRLIGGVKLTLGGVTESDGSLNYSAHVSLPPTMTGGEPTTIDAQINGSFSDPKITLGGE